MKTEGLVMVQQLLRYEAPESESLLVLVRCGNENALLRGQGMQYCDVA